VDCPLLMCRNRKIGEGQNGDNALAIFMAPQIKAMYGDFAFEDQSRFICEVFIFKCVLHW